MKKSKLLNIISIVLSVIGVILAIYGRESENKFGDLAFYGTIILVVGLLVYAASHYMKKKEI